MNKRIYIIIFCFVCGLLLPTAVARALLAANQPDAVTSVTLAGPKTGITGLVLTYTAETNADAIPPITYVWQAAGQTVTHTGGITDTFAMTWPVARLHPLTVTASDGGGTAVASRIINVLPPTNPLSDGMDIYANPRAPRAILASASPGLLGPHICTAYGDPFSPLNSQWRPGPYTYRYRIQIPASYPYDVVRVELFDPDSMNRPNPWPPSVTITRTDAAVQAGLSLTTTGNCSTNQRDMCLIATGELNLANNGTLPLDEINPYWFWRTDENRGAGMPPGNGNCSSPSSYNPLFNTDPLFQLYYYQDSGGAASRVELAAYTGQVGDGARDNGDHDTDLRWVSPGAAQSFDQSVFVPVDLGSPGNFEIDLTAETPGIMTAPVTGDRYLYLDVTALSGASENDFDIWAGPPLYTATVPSAVNARNLHLLNNPAAQDAFGVVVYALDYYPLNSYIGRVVETPLAYLPPEAADTQVTVTLFDSDSGSQPPITFFFDTVPESEWSVTFAQTGVPDPDGEMRNCRPGSCNNRWVGPAYPLLLPANFSGGRLMARFRYGFGDTFAWEVQNHPEPTAMTISGPQTGTTNITYTFQAVVSSPTVAEPLTYTWQTAGQPPIVHSAFLADAADFSWPTTGVKTVSVTAVNRYGAITTTQQVTITGPAAPPLAVRLNGRYDGVKGIPYTFTAVAQPTATLPITYIWQADGQTITHTGGLSDTLAITWANLGLQPLTVTAVNAMGSAVDGRVVNVLPPRERPPYLFGGPRGLYSQSTSNLALVKTASPSVFGQNICTAYGDPFSPLNSPWVPGPYTYEYVIQIPADYPSDVVRVEIFDPDSINQGSNDFTIIRTNNAVSQGLSPTLTAACAGNEAERKNACKLDTGEYNLVLSGTLAAEQVNPLWFVRVDENRGAGSAPGNGTCGEPAVYNATFNTQTLYDLYYWRDLGEYPTRQNLAFYTGQVGDGTRDTGDHDTDLRWVSPGAAQSFDQPVYVPVDNGSAGNFEINLNSEVPNILVDSATGDRYLHLNITALSGASKNSFQIWAGPPAYVNTVPSQANGRNLHLLNNPAAHNTFGVTVYALENLGQTWNLAGQRADFPLTYLGPEHAGQTVFLGLFDSDTGAQPPLTFYADSLPEADWSLAFAQAGIPDPDGQARNCVPGGCNNTWVSPPYAVTLPADYPGGRVMVRYHGGVHDMATWNMPAVGSVDVSGPITGTTDVTYTFTADAAYFLYLDPITYTWEIAGQPAIVHVGGITDEVEVSWPTDGTKQITVTAASDYFLPGAEIVGTHHISLIGLVPDLAFAGPLHLLTSLPLGAGQPVSFTTTITNMGDVDINEPFFVDIFLDPPVVLTTGIPITSSGGFVLVPALAAGASQVVTITALAGFANEPLTHTVYAMVDSGVQIAESDETNNVSAPLVVTDVHPLLTAVTLAGPALGLTGETYTFTATVTPSFITDPITYTWFIDDTPTLTMSNGTAVAAPFTWPFTGTYELLVIADHGYNTVTDTHTIVITDTPITDLAVLGAPQLLTPGPVQPHQPVSFTVSIANMGNMPITGSFQVDIFLDPAVVLTNAIPLTQSHGFVTVNGLAVGETAVFTFSVPAGFGDGPLDRAVYAMVDTTQSVAEADETNNVSMPLSLNIAWRLYLPIIRRG